MSGLNIIVFSEGKHELGGQLEECLSGDELPALPCLVHRLLGKPSDATYTCKSLKNVRAMRRSGFAGKAIGAIRQAKLTGFDAAVVVIDRDQESDKARIGALRLGRDDPSIMGFPPCAVGAAVEMFDAWMLADRKAIKQAGGDVGQSHTAPESLKGKKGTDKHPKERTRKMFSGPSGSSGLSVKYADVAGCVDLARLAKTCSKGFGPFATDVCERIGPLVARTKT